MTKETPFANRKLLLEELTNNESNEMEEEQMVEIEIKEGHDDVEEEQGNKAEETPIANRKLLLEKITNNKRNEIEEQQMEENEIKEVHEDVEEEQEIEFLNDLADQCLDDFDDMWFLNDFDDQCLDDFDDMWNRRRFLNDFHDECLDYFDDMWNRRRYWPRYTCDFLMKEGQMEEYNRKESQKKIVDDLLYWPRYTCDFLMKEGQMEEYNKKESQKKREVRIDQYEADRSLLYSQSAVSPPSTNWKENQESVMKILPFEEKMKIRRFLFRGGQSRRKLFFRKGRNKRVQRESEKLRQYLEIWGRYDMMQHTAPKQREKLINITKDHGGFDDAEKGGGNRTVCADCHLESRPGQADNLSELHAELTPNCPFVNVKKRNADQSNDFATQTVPSREPRVDVCRRNDVTQHAAPQQKGKLIDITEDHVGFDDAEKDIQELDQLLRCKVCLDSDACIVFLPCRHMATCEYCEGFLHHCPVCRSFIEEAVKINEE